VKWPILARAIATAAIACALAGFVWHWLSPPRETAEERSLRATPGVVMAIRDVARLEATSFHIEKVVEATDRQSRLWGFVQAKDALLLVAVGDVVAGVDLTKVRDGDVRVDATKGAVTIRLPPPEIVSSTLDERATHVYSRSTDALAQRDEQLEGEARRAAEEQMRKVALDEGILEKARVSTERTLRGLLRALGYERAEIEFRDDS
jgi:hypothetical protein